jgi:ribonuclease-3
MMRLVELQKKLGYQFKNRALLVEALTHPSLAHEQSTPLPHNQRLEFLGDAVLQLILTDKLYKMFPHQNEGELTQRRAHLANRHTLHRLATALELGDYLLLGKGEERSGGRTRTSNLSDALEAVIGAIHLDGGMRAARKVVLALYKNDLKGLRHAAPKQNPKGTLQELLQTRSSVNPVYRVASESGPAHARHYEVVVQWNGDILGRGSGPSKKAAETAAARAALAALKAEKT